MRTFARSRRLRPMGRPLRAPLGSAAEFQKWVRLGEGAKTGLLSSRTSQPAKTQRRGSDGRKQQGWVGSPDGKALQESFQTRTPRGMARVLDGAASTSRGRRGFAARGRDALRTRRRI